MKPGIHLSFIIVLALLSTALISAKEQPIPVINATRVNEEMAVDGYLNESVWQGQGYSALVQKEPVEGAEPTEATSVWIAYSEQGIYAAAKCYYSDSSSCTGGIARRDEVVQSDRFWFWIDPNKSGHGAFGFVVNPDGSIIDGKFHQDIYWDDSWDGVWEAAAKKHGDY
ncbi:MAG: hypothetical protein WBE28_03045, partial [bacterium]